MRKSDFLATLALLGLALLPTHLQADSVPDDLEMTTFSGSEVTPSPACLCVGADGTVFAGIDLNGSLGKGPGKGRIVRLLDEDKDGIADSHNEFAKIDNPRGLIAVGNQVFVLYTAFGEDGKSTGMNLAVLEDADRDGVADGPEKVLITGICAADAINSRGTDHSTNGIQLGIDGWIYIAVGDFGFANATGTDGTTLTHLGGGIVRVRPDGSEMELFTTGMRNIYDVAIDPLMNVFTRGNTNDGGGWNVRFNHHIQSGEYGYPRLFINFADEIIPALEDVGGGSGVGALFLSEPTWPEKYRQPLMADWGRQAVYLHRLEEDGPTFLQKAETFVQLSQVSDLDVDPSGQMFLSAWNGAGFKGDETKGYLVRVVPKDWKYEPAPMFFGNAPSVLAELIGTSESATARLHAQQALLASREGSAMHDELTTTIRNSSRSLESRVAALYTLNQITDNAAEILAFANDPALTEHALRAATDRLPRLASSKLPLEPFTAALASDVPRIRAAAAIALGRLGNPEAAEALLSVAYEKPAAVAAPKATPLATLKSGRSAKTELAVQPGQPLYLSLKETNPKTETPSQVIFENPTFVTSDKTRISLLDLAPAEGTVFNNTHPDGSPIKGKKKKPAIPTATAVAGQTLVYSVPKNAIRFETNAYADAQVKSSSVDFIASIIPPAEVEAPLAPRHATPNPDVILPHLAVRSLVRLEAVDACLSAIGTSSEDLALWALSYLHTPAAVEGLQKALADTQAPASRNRILGVLARLYNQEAPYQGDWWWSTRPDTRGPYYKPMTWEASESIAGTFATELNRADETAKTFLAGLNDRNRMGLESLGTNIVPEDVVEQPTVDLAKIASKQGAVGTTPIEDVILSLDTLKGDQARGEKLFTQQGCVACHALEQGGPALGPYMGQIGSIMNPEQIATAILRPDATISQGFQTTMLTLKDGTPVMGFVTESNADEMTLRDMTGQVKKIATKDVKEEKHLPNSMMPPGLANALSLEDFASLVEFLYSKKE